MELKFQVHWNAPSNNKGLTNDHEAVHLKCYDEAINLDPPNLRALALSYLREDLHEHLVMSATFQWLILNKICTRSLIA